MKHFIIEITYKVPFEKLSDLVGEHRKFLDEGYKSKLLLLSGPQNPKTGGIVIARAEDEKEIKEFFRNDPYNLNNVAEYRFIEYTPVKFQEIVKEWIE